MRWLILGAALGLLTTFSATAAPRLRVGVAKVKITPSLKRRVWIAGRGENRPAESVHDDVWARALVLERGKMRVALVALDLIGLSHQRIEQARKLIREVPGDRVIIASSHTHSGPDTIGLWGPNGQTTGRDPVYLDSLAPKIAAAVSQAVKNLRPATLSAGAITVPEGLAHNDREPIQDKTLTALRVDDEHGKAIATLINYGCHPEVMITDSHAISSDWIHYTRLTVEREIGGTAVFFNGALGGMISPTVASHTWPECERVGNGIGAAAVQALKAAKRAKSPRLRFWRRSVTLKLDNHKFITAAKIGLLEKSLFTGDTLQTEVCRLDMGPVRFLTIPGEVLPRPWLGLKAEVKAPYPVCIALGNDELGYILHPEDFPRDLYRYERSMSVGQQTWPTLLAAERELLAKK